MKDDLDAMKNSQQNVDIKKVQESEGNFIKCN